MSFDYGQIYNDTEENDRELFSQAFFDEIKMPQPYDRNKDPDIILWDKLDHQERFDRGLEDPVFFCKNFLHDEDGYPSFNFHFTAFQYVICSLMASQSNFIENFGKYPINPDRPKENYAYHQRKLKQFEFKGKPLYVKTASGAWQMRTKGVEVFSILVPRGCGKTTIARAMGTRAIAYGTSRTMLLTSRAQKHCEDSLNSIVSWMSTDRFKEYFGDRIPPNRSRLKNTADTLETITWNGCQTTVITASPQSQVRGLNKKGSRPDHIIMDDVNSTYAREEENTERDKVNNWFLRDIRPALARNLTRPNIVPKIICLATAIHPETLGVMLHEQSYTMSFRFSAKDADNDVLCTNLTPARLREYYAEAKAMGEPDAFLAEFMNDTSRANQKVFSVENFCYVPHCDITGMEIFIGVDPATSTKKSREIDYTAISVIGTKDGFEMVLLENIQEKGKLPKDIANTIINIAKQYNTTAIGIEAHGGQELYIHIVKDALEARKKTLEIFHDFEILPIKHHPSKTKQMRIEVSLQAATADRSLKFRCLGPDGLNPELKRQFEDFPFGRHDDGLDSTEIAFTMASAIKARNSNTEFLRDERNFGGSRHDDYNYPSPRQMNENNEDRRMGLVS